jgi:8-oxo-dGTP pyrophosphatase MutT (NUDIX family)
MRSWVLSCASCSLSSGVAASGVTGAAETLPTLHAMDNARARRRQAGRVLLLDADDRLLLLAGKDPADPTAPGWWFTPGGGAEDGESPEQAALRELEEETGLHLEALGPAVHKRHTAFRFDGIDYDQDEVFFLARGATFEPNPARRTPEERRVLVGHRWWRVDELASTDETIYPPGLAALLRRVIEAGEQAEQ